jgi:hypothetical protein
MTKGTRPSHSGVPSLVIAIIDPAWVILNYAA